MKTGIAISLIGLLLLTVFINNAILYPTNIANTITSIQEMAQQYGWEPETAQLLVYSVLTYNPTDGFTLLFAPSLQDLYQRGFLIDQLIKTEKVLAEAIETEGANIQALADAVNNLSQAVLVLQQNQLVLYDNQKLLQLRLDYLDQRVSQLENITADLSKDLQDLATRVAGLESKVSQLTSQPAGAVTNALYTATNTLDSIINPQGATVKAITQEVTKDLDPITQTVINYAVQQYTNPVTSFINNLMGWFGWW